MGEKNLWSRKINTKRWIPCYFVLLIAQSRAALAQSSSSVARDTSRPEVLSRTIQIARIDVSHFIQTGKRENKQQMNTFPVQTRYLCFVADPYHDDALGQR